MNILLDYAFPVAVITPTPSANTGFLKQVCVVAKPKDGGVTTGVTTAITVAADAADYFGSQAVAEVGQLFAGGKSKVFLLPMDDLDLADALAEHGSDFFTVLISSDFSDEDLAGDGPSPAVKASKKIQDITFTADDDGVDGNEITISYVAGGTAGSEAVTVDGDAIEVEIEHNVSTAQQIYDALSAETDVTDLVDMVIDIGDEDDAQVVTGAPINLENGADATTDVAVDLGTFKGVIGVYSDDEEVVPTYAAQENYAGFFGATANKAKNMFYAFGKLLSNALNWTNQQYITMPYSDSVETLGQAEAFFESKVSFVMDDDEFGKRLGLFAVGGKAIVAPYIIRNLEIELQSAALAYISGNQPAYTKKYATLLENTLKDTIQLYITRGWIEAGTVSIKLEQDNFVASGYINVAEPKALWRVFSQLTQTL